MGYCYKNLYQNNSKDRIVFYPQGFALWWFHSTVDLLDHKPSVDRLEEDLGSEKDQLVKHGKKEMLDPLKQGTMFVRADGQALPSPQNSAVEYSHWKERQLSSLQWRGGKGAEGRL